MPMWNSRRGSEKGMEFRTRFGDLNSFVLDSLRGLDETIQYGCGEYLAIGVLMPMWNSRRGSEKGMEFRTRFGDLNSFVLDSLRGLDETIQYGCGEKREEQMERKSVELDAKQKEMKKLEGTQRGGTNVLILIFSFGMLFLTTWLHQQGEIGFDAVLLCTILMMSSFGPVVALSSLSNNLMQTLASGERVLSLLEEEPQIEEVSGQATAEFADINCENIDFTKRRNKCPDSDFFFWNAVPYNVATSAGGNRI